jgi:hypothetical protein
MDERKRLSLAHRSARITKICNEKLDEDSILNAMRGYYPVPADWDTKVEPYIEIIQYIKRTFHKALLAAALIRFGNDIMVVVRGSDNVWQMNLYENDTDLTSKGGPWCMDIGYIAEWRPEFQRGYIRYYTLLEQEGLLQNLMKYVHERAQKNKSIGNLIYTGNDGHCVHANLIFACSKVMPWVVVFQSK